MATQHGGETPVLDCVTNFNMKKDKPDKENSKNKDVFYYMENGLMVFTEAYHLKRGYCCKNGCRHCPYGFKKT
jgi:hypothetical protein